MIESFIYLIARQDHPGVQRKTGSRQRRGWGAERRDALCLSSSMVFLFIISAKFFSLSHNDCLSLVSIAIGWKELPTGHTNHPTQTRFSRKAPVPTSDDLTIHFNHQTELDRVACRKSWCHSLTEDVFLARSNRKNETARERNCLLKCKWILCACTLAPLKRKIC